MTTLFSVRSWSILVLFLAGSLSVPNSSRAADAPAPAKPGLPIAELKRDRPVDFEKEILPTLRNNCLACHNTTKAKAGLNLETPQFILKGGENGPAVVPNKSAESLIFKAAAHLDPELVMPPKDNKANAVDFTPDQLALLKLWIEQGAKGEVHANTIVHWLEKPPLLDPILALDLTTDGHFAACSRGQRVDIYHVPSGQRVARLTDPKLAAVGLSGAAHRDLVNAVAFHPDGTLLATAGYREVKLWRRPHDVQERVLTNSASGIAALSADGHWLAIVTGNHTIQLVDLATDSIVRKLTGHSNEITALAFAPNHRQLASVSLDHSIRIWNVADGSIADSTNLPCELRAVTWLAKGQELAAAGADGVVRIFARTNLAPVRELTGQPGPVITLGAAGDGKSLLAAGASGEARLWDAAEGKLRAQFTQDVAIVTAAIRPDGRRIALAGTNAVVKLWDTDSAKTIAELKGDRYAYDRVGARERTLVVADLDIAFHKKSMESADAEMKKAETRIAKASATNTVTEKIFLEKEKALRTAADARSAAGVALTNLLAEVQRVTEAFEKADQAAKSSAVRATETAVRATDAQVAADRAAAAKADVEKMAADTASVASRAKAAVANADATKDAARRIAEESAAVAEKSRAFADAAIADADMKSKMAVDTRVAASKAIEEVAALSFAAGQLKPAYDKTLAEAPEKRKQATNQVDSTTKALVEAEKEFKRAETRKSVTNHELELATTGGQRASNVVTQARSRVANAESARKDATAALDQAKRQAASAEQPTLALAFAPDGRTLATYTADGRVHTWHGDSGAAFDVFPKDAPTNSPVTSTRRDGMLAFLDRDHLLAPPPLAATGARIWQINPGWTLQRTIGTGDADSIFADRVNALRFSPDGWTFATGGGEPTRSGEIRIFQTVDGHLLKEMSEVHSDAVLALDFAPDGRHLASSSADRFVKVIDLGTGKVIKAFEGHTSYVLGVAWKRDSRTLASAGADKMIKVWDFVTGDRRKNIEGADKDVTGIAYVGVTDQMLATSGDSLVRLLKESGEKVRTFEGTTDFMNSAAATPDGRIIIAGGQDGQLHIWNGADGKKIASFAP